MLLARIVGTVVATRKDERLQSAKLMVVRPIESAGKPEGNYLVAVDTVDAGVGETVLVVGGSSARMASGLKDCPVDAAIVGVIDEIDVPETGSRPATKETGSRPNSATQETGSRPSTARDPVS